MPQKPSTTISRRTFLGAAGAASLSLLLASCAGGGTGGAGGSGKPITFWNMPWGGTSFSPMDKEITLGYKPAAGLPAAEYQSIQWANFVNTFSTAVASNTGPAVSSGGSTLAFLFESQGKIAYADNLIESWKSNGVYDDFLPGLIDTMKTPNGYAAIPYNLDMRVLWYNQALLEKHNVEVPVDWDTYRTACAALKKKNIYGFGIGSGAGNHTGSHALVGFMINNGGGLFDADYQPNCVTPENIEAMEWVLGLVKDGYVDPAAATYTSANVEEQWNDHRFAMGIAGAGLPTGAVGNVAADLKVASPLTGPSGKQGALYFVNNIMMYTNTPSQEGSEAFLTYYYQNMAKLWTEDTGIGLPPLASITATPEFRANENNVKIIDEWLPISRVWGEPGSNTVALNSTIADGTPAISNFTQTIYGGAMSAKDALTALQKELESTSKG